MGGLVGETTLGLIKNSHATGTVTGGFNAGGLVGVSVCCTGGLSIINSYATGSVSQAGIAGGLISGLLLGDLVSGSHASGNVQAYSEAGGLVAGSDGTITNSYATGDVSEIGTDGSFYGGGLVAVNGAIGYITAPISTCFATGNVTGAVSTVTIGGLVGRTLAKGSITDSYATGNASIGGYVGGLVGYNEARVTQAYETGTVSQGQIAGGAVGRNYESDPTRVSSTYWDSTMSGQPKGVGKGQTYGITGLTDDQLKSGLPGGFDPSVWAENPNINGGYPYLIANPPPP
jgi:hypothetical protein